jgi:hypothetical protein
LKSLLVRGNISPTPPVLTAPRGGVSDPKGTNRPFHTEGEGRKRLRRNETLSTHAGSGGLPP